MEKILIIDDNKIICKTLKDILNKVGYKIIEAEDEVCCTLVGDELR